MWLVPYFIKKRADIALNPCIILYISGRKSHEGTLTSYFEMVNHLLPEYESDEIITETTDEVKDMKQQEYQTAIKF